MKYKAVSQSSAISSDQQLSSSDPTKGSAHKIFEIKSVWMLLELLATLALASALIVSLALCLSALVST